jgi:replicative DNA helicase
VAVDLVATSSQSPEFERTPPQNIEAEQCVLGGMLLSKDAIADVVESLRSIDFYRPAHSMVFDVIVDLYGRGEPADAVTVAAELSKQGQLQRVGGAPYLHTLVSAVPTAASAGYYARIVAEQAVLRRLVEAGTHIVQLGYGGRGADVDDIVDRAQQAVFDVTERRASEDYIRLEDLLQPTLDEIEAISSRDGTMAGVPTGFADLDRLTNGLHPGQLVIVAARPAIGKALALDTPLPTPSGWTTMGAVRVGDWLLGGDGRPARVTAVTGVLTDRPCYQVRFCDGTTIVADALHGWLTEDRAARRSLRTTEQLADTVRARGSGSLNHLVPLAAPLELSAQTLGLHPYALGIWLGHRHPTSATSPAADPEIAMYVDGCVGRRVDPSRALGAIGVLRHTHIPVDYLRASPSQRRDLLAGLLDADGAVTLAGTVQFSTTNARLAADVRELVVGLGHQAWQSTRPAGRAAAARSTSYTVTFDPAERVFRLDRKHLVHKERAAQRRPPRQARFITDVRRIASVPVRCIEVDNADHLYLASRAMIPTHNSTLGLDLARAASIRHNLTSVIFSLEMSRNEITMRLLSAEARVHLQNMRTGRMSDDDWARLARRMGEVASAPLFIDDSPNMTMMEIRAKARRLRQRNDLKLIVLDYMQLMSSPRKVENRQQEVSEISRSLKLLAKELEIPVVAISQLNRGPEQRADKKPQIADLRESGCMTADTTLLRADTGAPVTFRELLDNGHDGVLVWSLDDDRRLVAAPITNVFPSGSKPVFRLRLASGREVKATGNHPFLTVIGWTPLEQLAVGDRIAVPRHIPAPISPGLGWSEHRLGLLAHLIGDGCVARSHSAHYLSNDDNLPVPDWVSELGIVSRGPAAKRLPDVLHSASNAELATFLRYLWAADGTVTVPRPGGRSSPKARYVSSSRALADGVALLLARLGIAAQIRQVTRAGCGPSFQVVVADRASLRTFCREVGGHGRQRGLVERALAVLTDRDDAGHCAGAADVDDVLWDPIVSIEPLGELPVYDATVKGTHNFIADGIAAHNSLEQDADLVILLYREDAFEKESPRAGEADFIVAKHRNGPTDTITVAFQGHYSRFVDMAPS